MTKLIILTGQSNAEGANAGGPNPAPASVQVWDSTTQAWGSSDYTQLPLSATGPRGNGGNNNLGLSLACRLAKEYPAEDIFLVYYFVGGASITNWDTANGGTYMTALLAQISAALATTQLAGVTFDDISILWDQGEQDTGVMDFPTYQAILARVMQQIRAQTWCGQYVPILLFGLSASHNSGAPVKALHNYCEMIDRWCTFINTAGMNTSDGTHYDGNGLWEGGYYRAFNAIETTPLPQAIDISFAEPESSQSSLVLARTTVTIASGVIVATNSFHSVDTEAMAATDDLDTVNPLVNGMTLFLRAASSSRSVVAKNGTGNLALAGSDFTMDNSRDTLELIGDTGVGKWIEVGRSDNGA